MATVPCRKPLVRTDAGNNPGLTGTYFDEISQLAVIGERFPFARLVQDGQTHRVVALNPMRSAYVRRLFGRI